MHIKQRFKNEMSLGETGFMGRQQRDSQRELWELWEKGECMTCLKAFFFSSLIVNTLLTEGNISTGRIRITG